MHKQKVSIKLNKIHLMQLLMTTETSSGLWPNHQQNDTNSQHLRTAAARVNGVLVSFAT